MHKVFDGQQRSVQICRGLLKPFKVLLCNEITVDLDVSEERGATITYATHIFDGLEEWPTHIMYAAHGKLQLSMPMTKHHKNSYLSLMKTVESWQRKERDEERKRRKERKASSPVISDPARVVIHAMSNGWAAGKLYSTIAGEENFLSSNRMCIIFLFLFLFLFFLTFY
ncbi:hypothetical protein P3X46_008015 [Hevea brasiliensis]|uniref:Uncharacterized protein n=1 Tax=Hevea brasiliensis TaxID=3981 RepID=A0ABQ9MH77_HEVBR|nr:hypothetical protein P3X46_008015 [Hevea brasiliensis]